MKIQQFGVKAAIMLENKVLVIKRSEKEDFLKNTWDVPGGKIEFSEKPFEALKREIKEETNIDAKPLQIVTLWSIMKNPETQLIGATILYEYKKGKVKLSKEHTEYRWVTFYQLAKLEMHPSLKKDLLAAFEKNIEILAQRFDYYKAFSEKQNH